MDNCDSVFNLLSYVLTTVYSAVNLNFLCSVGLERFILHSTPKVQLFYCSLSEVLYPSSCW